MKVRFCQHNRGATAVVRQLKEQFPALDIKLKKCAKQCSTCKRQPFALVNGERVTADDQQALHTVLVSRIAH